MEKGKVILIPFPFTDLSGSKLRPVVVLFSRKDDVTVSFITSNTKWFEEFDLKIESSYLNGLKVDSVLKVSKIATISKDLVVGELGQLDENQILKLNQSLINILKLN